MTSPYTPTEWADLPATTTPIDAAALQRIEDELALLSRGTLPGVYGLPGLPNQYLRINSALQIVPMDGDIPTALIDAQYNVTNTPDTASTLPSSVVFANPVNVTGPGGTALLVTVPASIGRPVNLSARMAMQVFKGTSASVSANLNVAISIYEATPQSVLDAAGLLPMHFSNNSALVPPNRDAGFFLATLDECIVDAAQFPSTLTAPRQWGLAYQLENFTVDSAGNGNYIQNVNQADTGTVYVYSRSLTSNVATIFTVAPHYIKVGDSITVANAGSTFNGTFTVTSVPTATSLTYAKTNANVAAANVFGTVTPATQRVVGKARTRLLAKLV